MSRLREDPLESLQREVERLFHDLVYHRHPATHFSEPAWQPPADLVVSEHAARVLLELAGVPRETVRVTLRGRTLELPWEADENAVEARYKNGMVEIYLKPVAAPATTEIPVRQRQSK